MLKKKTFAPFPTNFLPTFQNQRSNTIWSPTNLSFFDRKTDARNFLLNFSKNKPFYLQLKTLDLGETSLDDNSLKEVIEHLITNQELPLISLDLSGNNFSDTGAQLLCKALANNTRMTDCNLKGNTEIYDNTLDAIKLILERNKNPQNSMTDISVQHPTIPCCVQS